MIIHVITAYPSDYPGKFVLRRWLGEDGHELPELPCLTADTLETARALLPENCTPLPLLPGEDPVIAEMWAEAGC